MKSWSKPWAVAWQLPLRDKFKVRSWVLDVLSNLDRYILFGASQVVLVVKNLVANAGNIRDLGFDPWVRNIPWRRA